MADASAEPVFGVLESVSGLLWKTRGCDYRKGLALSQRLNIPSIVGQVLAARSVDLQNAESFLVLGQAPGSALSLSLCCLA